MAIVLSLLFIEYIRRFRPKYLGFIVSLFAIAIIMTAFLVPASYWERQKSVTHTKTESSVARRTTYIYAAWDFFKENPFLGSGPGTFRDMYEGTKYAFHYTKAGHSMRRAAHNAYLEVLTGKGMIGLAIFSVIILLALKNFNVSKKQFHDYGKKEMASLIGAYRTSFISMLLLLFVLSADYHKYLWASFALSQVALRLSQKMQQKETDESTG